MFMQTTNDKRATNGVSDGYCQEMSITKNPDLFENWSE